MEREEPGLLIRVTGERSLLSDRNIEFTRAKRIAFQFVDRSRIMPASESRTRNVRRSRINYANQPAAVAAGLE